MAATKYEGIHRRAGHSRGGAVCRHRAGSCGAELIQHKLQSIGDTREAIATAFRQTAVNSQQHISVQSKGYNRLVYIIVVVGVVVFLDIFVVLLLVIVIITIIYLFIIITIIIIIMGVFLFFFVGFNFFFIVLVQNNFNESNSERFRDWYDTDFRVRRDLLKQTIQQLSMNLVSYI